MQFQLLSGNIRCPASGNNMVYLRIDNWNDFSFVTMFDMYVFDEKGQQHDVGKIKIGFKGQTTGTSTYQIISNGFESLGDNFFSLGQGIDFYRKMASLPNHLGRNILKALRDIVQQPEIIEEVKDEDVFSAALLRNVSLSVIKGQLARVLEGRPELTNFKFRFVRPESEHLGPIDLTFDVEVASTPSTNIHAVIGRNGIGKTTLLNGMIEAITDKNHPAKFFDTMGWVENQISDDYFSSLVSVSFSAFDPFTPPQERPDPSKGTCYFYIGLKDSTDGERHRTIKDLRFDCVKALIKCFNSQEKTARWLKAIEQLGSDENFAFLKLEKLEAVFRDVRRNTDSNNQSDSKLIRENYQKAVDECLSCMSSGHAIVLLTITRLVATVEEKTLVLLDEPESHLHPPLLSAFIRALADLLYDQNGVAVIATHSPVVLQEIPQSCVWKIYRIGKSVTPSRPSIETFGENVGLLTSEVFSLEVARSGFHNLLTKSVESGRTYDEIVADYSNRLGFEGRSILKALVANRDRSCNHDAIS